LEVFYNLLRDDVGVGKIGAVFERFVFEPEPSRRDASERDGRVGRPIERVRRSKDVEVGFIVLKGSTRAVKSEDQTPAPHSAASKISGIGSRRQMRAALKSAINCN